MKGRMKILIGYDGSECADADHGAHRVLVPGREIHGKRLNVAGLEADALHPLVVVQIR